MLVFDHRWQNFSQYHIQDIRFGLISQKWSMNHEIIIVISIPRFFGDTSSRRTRIRECVLKESPPSPLLVYFTSLILQSLLLSYLQHHDVGLLGGTCQRLIDLRSLSAISFWYSCFDRRILDIQHQVVFSLQSGLVTIAAALTRLALNSEGTRENSTTACINLKGQPFSTEPLIMAQHN